MANRLHELEERKILDRRKTIYDPVGLGDEYETLARKQVLIEDHHADLIGQAWGVVNVIGEGRIAALIGDCPEAVAGVCKGLHSDYIAAMELGLKNIKKQYDLHTEALRLSRLTSKSRPGVLLGKPHAQPLSDNSRQRENYPRGNFRWRK